MLLMILKEINGSTNLTGPSVAQDGSHIYRSVCHNRVVVPFLLAFCFIFNLCRNKQTFKQVETNVKLLSMAR